GEREQRERELVGPARVTAHRSLYFTRQPASTGSATPVMYRASSDARKSSALLMSLGCTHGIGSVCIACEIGAKSSCVGFSTSGQKSLKIVGLSAMSVATWVGMIALTRMLSAPSSL